MAGSKFGRLFGRRGSKDEHSSGSEPVEEIQVQEAEDQPEEAQTNSLGTDSDASPPPAAQIGPEAPGALHAEKPPHPACNGGPSPPPFSSLSSHPVTPDRDHSPHHAQKPSGGSSSSGGGSGRGGAAGNGEFQAHLKKVTASLVDLLDQMSTNSASTSPAGSTRGTEICVKYESSTELVL